MRIEGAGSRVSEQAPNGHSKKDSWMSQLRGLFGSTRIDDQGADEELPSPSTMVRPYCTY